MTSRCRLLLIRILIPTLLWWSTQPGYAYIVQIWKYPKLEINGNNTLALNLNQVSGSSDYFTMDNYGHEKTLQNTSNLYINGELYRDLYLNSTLSFSPYAPDNTRWNLRYDGGSAKVLLGDFTANMAGNDYVLLNRSLTGVQVDAVLPRGTFTTIRSELSSPVHTDTLYGRNVSGPYYLTSTPIMAESEQVMINNVRKTRGLDKDYTLDYTNGILDFSPGIIVSPADTITVSYEVLASGLGGGTLTAVRGSYPVLKHFTVGVTHLSLQGHSLSSSTSDKRDQFLGNALPGPFYLTYRPIVTQSEIVTINGTLQARDTAYAIDYTTGSLLFKSGYEPPQNSTVIIRYNISEPGQSGADRQVTGADMTYQPLKALGFNFQAARSEGGGPTVVPARQIVDEPIVVQPGVPLSQQTFYLKNHPIQTGTDTARALSQPLARGSDYTIDYTTGQLRLLKDTLPTSLTGASIFVTYSTVATSSTPAGDTALAFGATLNTGKLTGSAKFRDVDPGFSPLDMVGYRNIQRSTEWQASYLPSKTLTLSLTGNTDRSPYNPYGTTVANATMMDDKNQTLSLDWHPGGLPQFTLQHSTRDSNEVGAGLLDSSAATDSLAISWAHKALSSSLSLNRTSNDSRQPTSSTDPYAAAPDNPSATDPITRYLGVTTNASFNLSFQPTQRFMLSTNLAHNNVTSTTNGVASDASASSTSLSSRYQLTRTLAFTTNLQSSQTGSTQTIAGSSIPAQSTQNLSFGSDWHPLETFTLALNYTTDHSNGGLNSNSTSQNLSANANWAPTRKLSFNGYWFHQNLRYLDTSGSSTNNMLGFGTEIHPFGGGTLPGDLAPKNGGYTGGKMPAPGSAPTGTTPTPGAAPTGTIPASSGIPSGIGVPTSNGLLPGSTQTPGGRPAAGSAPIRDKRAIGKPFFNFDVQHVWGSTVASSTQLMQAEVAMASSVMRDVASTTQPVASGNVLTTLSGKITFPIAPQHDLFVNGETVRSSGFPSSSVKNSFGLGWNYHMNSNLTFTLNALRTAYTDNANPTLDYSANQLTGQATMQF